jgi:tetratricopeptide (TPR) repeat protein
MKNSSTISWLIVSGLILCLPAVVRAQNVNVIADREAARRQAHIPRGEEALARAQAELHAKQYAQAHDDFRAALRYLPDSAVTGKSYSAALDGFCESGVKLAEQRIAEGKYEESEVILNEILSDPYNPNCREARALLTHLHDPGYINKTMGPKFLAKVEETPEAPRQRRGNCEQHHLLARLKSPMRHQDACHITFRAEDISGLQCSWGAAAPPRGIARASRRRGFPRLR